MHKWRTGTKPIVSIRWDLTVEEHQKTHHVLTASDLLPLPRQCAPVLITNAFERWVTQVPGEGALMTRGGFVRVLMGCERGLG